MADLATVSARSLLRATEMFRRHATSCRPTADQDIPQERRNTLQLYRPTDPKPDYQLIRFSKKKKKLHFLDNALYLT